MPSLGLEPALVVLGVMPGAGEGGGGIVEETGQ